MNTLEMLFPEDVMSVILLWLPIAMLLWFKFVCKSWYSLIQNPIFINQHYNHPHFSNNHENIFCVHRNHRINRDDPLHFNISLRSGNNNFHEFQNIELPPTPFNKPRLNTSYNGVVCLQHGESHKDFALYKPTLEEFKILSEPPSLEQSEYCIHGGFGFDCVNNDYRVVRVAVECASNSEDYTMKTKLVDVYSLSINSWRNIDAVVVPGYVIPGRCKTSVRDGRYYCWLAVNDYSSFTYDTEHHIIMSFEFIKEVFEATPLPDVYDIEHDIGADLGLDLVTFNNNISCVETVRDVSLVPGKFVFNVWLLNEYGVKESWTKLYTTSVEHSLCSFPFGYEVGYDSVGPVTFLKNGDIIWLEDLFKESVRKLSLWVHVTKEVKILPDQRDYVIWPDQVVAYKESLLSVNKLGMQLTM